MKILTIDDLTKAHKKALLLAKEHHLVEVGRGFGRDKMTPNAINASVYVKLVTGGLLTPHPNGDPFTGEALRVESGKSGWLTKAGAEIAATLKSGT